MDGDEGEGLWSTLSDVLPKYTAGVRCAIGGVVFLKWDKAWSHDLMQLASQAHYDSCDFTDAKRLVAPTSGSGTESYSYQCETPGETIYLACSVNSHCKMGQKVVVTTSSSVQVHPEPGGVHMASLAATMHMLNHPSMDTGFGTEAQANATLELIWCLEAHCAPSGGSARDFHPDATEASCLADVHNLAGYVTRSRPQPNYPLALQYYDDALSHVPTHCPTLEYRTELFLQTGKAAEAVKAALRLCAACGPASDVVVIAKAAFTSRPIAAFPTAECDAFQPPPSPPPSTETVVLTLTASGSVSDYSNDDISSLQQKIANAVSVDKSLVRIEVAAASVLITATITMPASMTVDDMRRSLSSNLGTAESASIALGITVEKVPTMDDVSTIAPDSSPPPPPSSQPPPSQPPPSQPPPSSQPPSDDNTALVIGITVVALLLAALLACAGMVRLRRNKRSRVNTRLTQGNAPDPDSGLSMAGFPMNFTEREDLKVNRV